MKTALITGGCGFIGFELAKKLIEKGYDVDIVDNLSIGYEAKNPKVKNVHQLLLGMKLKIQK